MPAVQNLFALIPAEMPDELVGEILRTDTVRIERIVSRGHASPPGFWYDQETDEWVLLVKGSAVLRFADGRKVALGEGDHLLIPRHVRHRVERTAPNRETIWLAVHFHGVSPGQGSSGQENFILPSRSWCTTCLSSKSVSVCQMR